MPVTTSKLPCHYVDYLCSPGLTTRGGVVPLQMYMGAHLNGTNSADFLDALWAANLKDKDSPWWTPSWCVPLSELIPMRKGQGNDAFYVRLWDWIWDNQEQLGKASSPVLRNVYDKYFVRKVRDKNPLIGMVMDAYFGNECIGFVSNYLRFIKLWDSYKGVANHSWSIHFPTKIQRLQDVRSLDLLEWTTYGHVALVDDVVELRNGQLVLDISQCSAFPGDGLKGPMSNKRAILGPIDPKKTADPVHTRFDLSGNVPVKGELQVRRMPNLQYSSPRFPYTPFEADIKPDEVYRR